MERSDGMFIQRGYILVGYVVVVRQAYSIVTGLLLSKC